MQNSKNQNTKPKQTKNKPKNKQKQKKANQPTGIDMSKTSTVSDDSDILVDNAYIQAQYDSSDSKDDDSPKDFHKKAPLTQHEFNELVRKVRLAREANTKADKISSSEKRQDEPRSSKKQCNTEDKEIHELEWPNDFPLDVPSLLIQNDMNSNSQLSFPEIHPQKFKKLVKQYRRTRKKYSKKQKKQEKRYRKQYHKLTKELNQLDQLATELEVSLAIPLDSVLGQSITVFLGVHDTQRNESESQMDWVEPLTSQDSLNPTRKDIARHAQQVHDVVFNSFQQQIEPVLQGRISRYLFFSD